jgi:hypothetical protein
MNMSYQKLKTYCFDELIKLCILALTLSEDVLQMVTTTFYSFDNRIIEKNKN